MPSLRTLFTIPLLIPTILAGVVVQRANGPARTDHYIVQVKNADDKIAIRSESVKHQYRHVFSGFSAELTKDELETLRHDPNVEAIHEDGISRIASHVTQSDAPWGLERISNPPKIVQHSNPLSYNYTYDDAGGSGVDVYVVDTGINVDHVQFQGRARLGAAFGFGSAVDDNGHGTHVAGIVGSLQFGVAKKVNLIAVKVLDADGNGYTADIVASLDWVIAQAAASGRPTVVLLAHASGRDPTIDAAAQAVVSSGIHLVAAAGNANIPVSQMSPGTVPDAITVGAVDINDVKATFSNYGPEIDIHAPGISVISPYIGSTTATASLSGTSQASAHVAGLVAYLISLHGNMSPQAMGDFIKVNSIKGAITGLPSGTANNLAYNGIQALQRRRQALRNNLRAGPTRSRRDRFARRMKVGA